MSKRIILVRHGEEPKQKKIGHIQTKIGLNNQGAIRSALMPEIVHSLIGDESYELHTYTHILNNEPTSRSFHTSQLLKNQILYDKNDDIEQLVDNVKKSASSIIIVCWEHAHLPTIMARLIGVHSNWDHISKKIYKKLDKKYKLKSKQKINLKDITTIKYCSDEFLKENTKVRDYYIEPEEDIGYALVWDITYDVKKYKVYPSYLIKKCKKHNKRFKIFKYIEPASTSTIEGPSPPVAKSLEAFENEI